MSVDLYLFNLINGLAKKSSTLDFFAVFFAKYLPYLLLVFLLFFALMTKRLEIFIIPFLSLLFARFLVNEAVYLFYKRKRPLELMAIKSLIEKPDHPSFPSSHSSAFFGLSFALLFYNMPLGAFFLAATCLIVFSRILCGVHWPSDVLAGAVVGFLSFLAIYSARIILV